MQVLEDVGFVNVKAEDRTGQFVKMLEKELKRIENIKDDFIKVSKETSMSQLKNSSTVSVFLIAEIT